MTDKNDAREIFGWKMYDWANSAFYTTVVAALFSPYITRLAQTADPGGAHRRASEPTPYGSRKQ